MDPLISAIVLVTIGLFVVVLELFIPSAGMLGVLAAVLLISGVIVGFLESAVAGTFLLLAVALILPILFALMIKVWPNTPIGRRIMVEAPKSTDVLPISEHLDEMKLLVGKIAVAKTKMLPSGIVEIDDKPFDAVCEGFAIEVGDRVKVVAVRSNRIYVQPYNPDDDMATNFDEARLLEKSLDELGLNSADDSKS